MISGEMAAEVPNIKLKIDPQDLQIQTFTVRKLLEPLIIQDLSVLAPDTQKKDCIHLASHLTSSVVQKKEYIPLYLMEFSLSRLLHNDIQINIEVGLHYK
ncbi:PREDICTED: catenin alpha-3-like [Gavialis gangeticus]|uniref:catenin alpha-3-like n=1 Tax=Gavialis gangeticus TaxID=94835 RepID=UPI00092E622C|nr:PREDICTED: catenin alpha-3-like [Gavialis gangeticus]